MRRDMRCPQPDTVRRRHVATARATYAARAAAGKKRPADTVFLVLRIAGPTATEAEAMRPSLDANPWALERDPHAIATWRTSRPLAPQTHTLHILGPTTVPFSQDLDLQPGRNDIAVPCPPKGTPIELRIRMAKASMGALAAGVVRMRDAEGQLVVEESFWGHFDDLEQHLVVRRFALPPGRYDIEVGDGKHTPHQALEVAASAPPIVLEMSIE